MNAIAHPPHYNSLPAKCSGCGHPIECIDVTSHMNFNRGNAVKYIWRAGEKDDEVEDLRKAIQYLEFEIGRLGGSVGGDASDRMDARLASQEAAE